MKGINQARRLKPAVLALALATLCAGGAQAAGKAVTWDDILRTMNTAPNDTAFMGVNGIDNDPHAHPYARTDKLGTTCTAATSCGGEGNLCVKHASSTKKVCASVCIDDAGCPNTYRCASVATASTLSGKACVKR